MPQTGIITFKGKLDNLVGARNQKGTYSIRRLNKKTKQPNTTRQIQARAKFLALSQAASTFSPVLPLLTPYAKKNKISTRNAFIKLNYPAAQAEGLTATLDPAQIILATGNQPLQVIQQTYIPHTPSDLDILALEVEVFVGPPDPRYDDTRWQYIQKALMILYHPASSSIFMAQTSAMQETDNGNIFQFSFPGTLQGLCHTYVIVASFPPGFDFQGEYITHTPSETGGMFLAEYLQLFEDQGLPAPSKYAGAVQVPPQP